MQNSTCRSNVFVFVLALLLFISFGFTWTITLAYADESASGDAIIFYAKDDSKIEQFKARVFNGLVNRPNDTGTKTTAQTTIDVSEFGLVDADITYHYVNGDGNTYTGARALGYIVYDHPLFSSLCISTPNLPNWNAISFEYENGYISSVSVTFNYSGWNWNDELLSNFKTYYLQFYSNAPTAGSDFQKVVYIHDWLCSRVSYSEANANGSFAIGTIANGKAVCAGYSYAFQFLCQQLGLECSYIYDYPVTVQHAWNKVKVDRQWFYVDTTWDDGAIVGSIPTYKYFLLNDSEFEVANNGAHGAAANWQNSAPINKDYYFANKYWQDKQVPLSDELLSQDPQLTKIEEEHTHSWDTGIVTTAATCTTAGVTTYTCATCGATKTENKPAALGHSYKQTAYTSPTCSNVGSRTYTCERCGHSYTEVIPATGSHTWDAGTITKQPTKGATGSKKYTCTVCGATKTETIAKLSSVPWTRLWGSVRYDTMRAISSTGWSKSSTVIVASGVGYADALSASSLAGLNGCPILLTTNNTLSEQTRSEIKRLGATTAYVIGGPKALSTTIDTQIKALGCKVVRLYGQTRQGTALAVANQVGSSHGDTCIIASGSGFADALAIAPYSYTQKAPIYLTEGNTKLSLTTLSAIRSAGFTKAIIVGGSSVVSTTVETQLKSYGVASVTRKGGKTRYDTSTLVANWCISQGMTTNYVALASGKGFADALAGAALCGKNNSVLVIADDANRSTITGFVASRTNNIVSGYALGGEASVSRATWNSLPR